MSILRTVNNAAQRLVHGAPPDHAPADLASIPLTTLHGDPLDPDVIRGKVVRTTIPGAPGVTVAVAGAGVAVSS